MSHPGCMFVFEGVDGVGKTSIATEVTDSLSKLGINAIYMSFPGRQDGALGKLVYELHHNKGQYGIEAISETALQALHLAAHLDAIENSIIPAIESGKVVILDRYWWSMVVYGLSDGVDSDLLNQFVSIENKAWGSIVPKRIFHVVREHPLRNEPEEKWINLVKLYEEFVTKYEMNCAVNRIENEGSVDFTVHEVMKLIGLSLSECGAGSDVSQSGGSVVSSSDYSNSNISVYSKLSPAKESIVYDTYWQFAAERQRIFFKRIRTNEPSWTTDPVLAKYKFTNAYRASDRVSQYLIKNVIYAGNQDPMEIFFRIILFKLFNKIDTWQLLEHEFGEVSYANYTFKHYDDLFTNAMERKVRIYSAAYIMPSGTKTFNVERKHRAHLLLLERMMEDELPLRIASASSMKEGFDLLRSYPLIGDFLAYQYITDLNYSALCDFSEMEFVVPGPGALSGIRKCFSSLGGFNEQDIIRIVADRQQLEFEKRDIHFQDLWGRKLQLIDCQNIFCETDKYSRVQHPEISGIGNRTRIKQAFNANIKKIEYWYPPKWNLNSKI